MLISWYAYAAASDPDRLPYDLSFWRAGASTVGTALSVWLAYRRSFVVLPVAAATAVGTVALGALNEHLHGVYVTRTWEAGSIRDIIFNRAMPVVNTIGSVALTGVAVASAVDRVRKTSLAGAVAKGVRAAAKAASVGARMPTVAGGVPTGLSAAALSQAASALADATSHASKVGSAIAKAASKVGLLAGGVTAQVSPLAGVAAAKAASSTATAATSSAAASAAATAATAAAYPSRTPLLSAPWYPLVRKLGLYFMTFSMLGHWVEMLFCTGIKYGIFKGGYDRSNHMLWDQWLFPFPAEGTAAVLADLALVPVKEAVSGAIGKRAAAGLIPEALALPLSVAISFLANQIVCTSVDYGTGMVANRNYELWDYRDMRFNFQGQICLQNSLFYSIIATWGVWWLLPVLEKAMARAGNVVLDGALVGFGSFFIFLELLYQCVPPGGFKA